MRVITAGEAQTSLQKLLHEAALSHEPIQILGGETNGILLSEDDWRTVEETLFLLAIPGMRESIQEGLQTSLEECAEDVEW